MPPVDYDRLERLGRELLKAIGEDPAREALVDTPRRWAAWWREFIDFDPGRVDTTFESEGSGQLVVVSGLRVWSLCEHHLLPFWCDVSIGYRPTDRVLGLSKFGRIAHAHAHALQVQERLVEGIASEVADLTGSDDVIVLAEGQHLCMTMRGVKTPALMSSTALRGVFAEDASARAEFYRLARR